MKITEIVSEAKMHRSIRKEVVSKGYQFLGSGQDQDVFLAPDGTILKIFGTDRDAGLKNYSEGQQSLIDFARYCQANASNPFLPTFGGIERFEFNGKFYLQIQCERLFELTGTTKDIDRGLEEIDLIVRSSETVKKNVNTILQQVQSNYGVGSDRLPQAITAIGGEEGLALFVKTIIDLDRIAQNKGYNSDLHAGNFMASSDGNVVINDPFFTGTWR